MLLVKAVNISGLADVSDYEVDVYINYTKIAGGSVTGHTRNDGWRELLRKIADSQEIEDETDHRTRIATDEEVAKARKKK